MKRLPNNETKIEKRKRKKKQKPQEEQNDSGAMTFLEHLEELRGRIIRSIVAMVIGMLVGWFFREEIRAFLEAPLYDAWAKVPGLPAPKPLSFVSLMEPFVAYLKMSAIFGIFFAAPVIFYHLWKFVAPGLYPREKRLVLPFVFISSGLFITGALGAYRYVFPIGFSFFLQFSAGGVTDELVTELPKVVTVERAAPAKKSGKSAKADKADKAGSPNGTGRLQGTKSPKPKAASTPKVRPQESRSSVTDAFSAKATSFAQTVYGWVQDRLLGSSCGRLMATRKKEGVVLRYRQSLDRCPQLPRVTGVLRDGVPVNVRFSPSVDGRNGVLLARDQVTDRRAHQYQVAVVFPAASKLAPVLMVREYLDFAIKLLLAFGLVFELPIFIYFLAFAGLVTAKQLWGFGRWFLVISVVVGAMLTPPDVVTQLLLATPLVTLYYLSVIVVFFMERGRLKQEKKG